MCVFPFVLGYGCGTFGAEALLFDLTVFLSFPAHQAIACPAPAADTRLAVVPFGVQPRTQLSLDYLMQENYAGGLASHVRGCGAALSITTKRAWIHPKKVLGKSKRRLSSCRRISSCFRRLLNESDVPLSPKGPQVRYQTAASCCFTFGHIWAERGSWFFSRRRRGAATGRTACTKTAGSGARSRSSRSATAP